MNVPAGQTNRFEFTVLKVTRENDPIQILTQQIVSSTLKTVQAMIGLRMVQRSVASRHMVTTRQLITEDSLSINRVTGGLGNTRTAPPRRIERL